MCLKHLSFIKICGNNRNSEAFLLFFFLVPNSIPLHRKIGATQSPRLYLFVFCLAGQTNVNDKCRYLVCHVYSIGYNLSLPFFLLFRRFLCSIKRLSNVGEGRTNLLIQFIDYYLQNL